MRSCEPFMSKILNFFGSWRLPVGALVMTSLMFSTLISVGNIWQMLSNVLSIGKLFCCLSVCIIKVGKCPVQNALPLVRNFFIFGSKICRSIRNQRTCYLDFIAGWTKFKFLVLHIRFAILNFENGEFAIVIHKILGTIRIFCTPYLITHFKI